MSKLYAAIFGPQRFTDEWIGDKSLLVCANQVPLREVGRVKQILQKEYAVNNFGITQLTSDYLIGGSVVRAYIEPAGISIISELPERARSVAQDIFHLSKPEFAEDGR